MWKKFMILLDKNISDLGQSFCNPQDQPYELACKIKSGNSKTKLKSTHLLEIPPHFFFFYHYHPLAQ